jgi:hypothetical protein
VLWGTRASSCCLCRRRCPPPPPTRTLPSAWVPLCCLKLMHPRVPSPIHPQRRASVLQSSRSCSLPCCPGPDPHLAGLPLLLCGTGERSGVALCCPPPSVGHATAAVAAVAATKRGGQGQGLGDGNSQRCTDADRACREGALYNELTVVPAPARVVRALFGVCAARSRAPCHCVCNCVMCAASSAPCPASCCSTASCTSSPCTSRYVVRGPSDSLAGSSLAMQG